MPETNGSHCPGYTVHTAWEIQFTLLSTNSSHCSEHSSYSSKHTIHTTDRITSAIPSHLIGSAHLWPLQSEFDGTWKERKSEPQWEQESGFCLFVLLNQFLKGSLKMVTQWQQGKWCLLSTRLSPAAAAGSWPPSTVKG